MNLHANAALTIQQRQEVRRLHLDEKVSIRKLAVRFGVNPSTIQRWVKRDSPQDRSTAPKRPHTLVTPAYHAAIVAYRQQYPHHGPIRIALALKSQFPFAHRGTVQRILHQQKLARPKPTRPKVRKPIPVGWHRIQMDVQQLPAIQGQKGFEYKISAIHLRTRVKYSEIHPQATSPIVAEVLRRAMDRLPPFFSCAPTTH